jgi:hypothetical protein
VAYIDIPSKTALILLNTDGADDPDQLVGVAAGELFEWAWLITDLADWLDHADEHTRADFDRFFGYRSTEKTAWFPRTSPRTSPRCSTATGDSHEHRRPATNAGVAGR